jgi:hypothetical protein
MSASIIIGHHPERGKLFAAVDASVHHVDGRIAERRFAAFLAPFVSTSEAKAALVAAGAELEVRNG